MNILVIGGGFAGKLLTWFLLKNGAGVNLVDDADPGSATRVSAGIIKPITGRRIVKTANADRILPFAFDTYRTMKELSGVEVFRDKPVLQIFTSEGNRNDWMARSADDDVKDYLGDFIAPQQYSQTLHTDFGGVLLRHSGFADPPAFERAMDILLDGKCIRTNSTMEADSVGIKETGVTFRGSRYDLMVLCQGPRTSENALTSWIPFRPVKGEIIDFESETLQDDFLISSGIYIVPLGGNKFRAGSTYQWTNLNSDPEPAARAKIEEALRLVIKCDYRVTGQKAGVRPAIVDRRPVIGYHPTQNRVGIFNGLGTKGAMQGPYYAARAASYFLGGIEPDADVDLRRFLKFYQ